MAAGALYFRNSIVGYRAQIPGKKPVNAIDAAEQLRALASRVRRNVPVSGDPERFHMEASEIAHDLVLVAEQIVPSTLADRRTRDRTESQMRPVSPTLGRTVITTTVIAGRRVAVQRRRLPFAVHARD